MSYIKNISAGENIIIEDLGDNSIRIHNNYCPINLKLKLSSYFDCDYSQAKLTDGDTQKYFHIKNCIFKINGIWHELPDTYFYPTNGALYDVYLRVYEETNTLLSEIKVIAKIVFYHRGYYYQEEANKIIKVTTPYDHHLFRFTVVSDHLEVIRMQPNLIDLDCIQGGFSVYQNYSRIPVRRTNGQNPNAYQGIPTYSNDYGAILLDTPILKNAQSMTARYLAYKGENTITLKDK